jgi:hypothetical protein
LAHEEQDFLDSLIFLNLRSVKIDLDQIYIVFSSAACANAQLKAWKLSRSSSCLADGSNDASLGRQFKETCAPQNERLPAAGVRQREKKAAHAAALEFGEQGEMNEPPWSQSAVQEQGSNLRPDRH